MWAVTGRPERGTAAGFVLTRRPLPLGTLLSDIWGSRTLLATLARKEFHVRYRRATLGLLWAVALPLFQAVVLSLVFSRVVRVQTEVDYTVFVYGGMVAWSFFSMTLGSASTAIVDGAGLSTKIYFPRVVLSLVPVAANVYGLVLSTAVLLGMCVVRDVSLGPEVVLLVPALALLVALTAAFAVVLSALHVYLRDVRYIVQALLLAWFYVTPVVYPLGLAGGYARWLMANPLTGVVELVRTATMDVDDRWLGSALGWSLGWTVGLALVGLALHRRYDRLFSDLL
jgi:ABC-type polysaccharide/polyol phosphate export permease